jgi:hypothetical protein
MQKFDKSFNEELIKEIPVISIGIFPGKFKPPHRGHFKTAQEAGKENKVVYILISELEHQGFTADQSLQIWDIYRNYIPNIEPYIVTRTPMAATYELLNILNNGGEFVSTKTTSAPMTNIFDVIQNSNILETYLNKGNNFEAKMYSSPEDKERYRNIKPPIYIGRNVTDIQFRPVDRLTSATEFRKAIASQNRLEMEKFLPSELSKNEKIQIINILLTK